MHDRFDAMPHPPDPDAARHAQAPPQAAQAPPRTRRTGWARRLSGLTLLEVVMTLAVMAVLGALALPGMGSQLDRQRLRHAANTLAGDLAEARFLAAQRGQAVHVLARDGPDWCWSVSLDPGCGCGSPQACRIHAVAGSDHPGIRLLAPMSARLEPNGLPEAPTHVVFESRAGDQLRVDVTQQGRSRVCAVSGKWPQMPACP